MKVPAIFFGEYQRVKAEARKVITKLLKGTSIGAIFGAMDLVESDEHPDSLFWLGRAWSSIGKQQHFPLCVMAETFFNDPRMDGPRIAALRPSLMEYFSQHAWGTIVLNSTQSYQWATTMLDGYGLEPNLAAWIIEGTLRFWDEFVSQGKRFFFGGSSGDFFYTSIPLCSFVITRCGINTSEFPLSKMAAYPPPPAYGDLKRQILKYDLSNRMRNDAAFREKARKGELYRGT